MKTGIEKGVVVNLNLDKQKAARERARRAAPVVDALRKAALAIESGEVVMLGIPILEHAAREAQRLAHDLEDALTPEGQADLERLRNPRRRPDLEYVAIPSARIEVK